MHRRLPNRRPSFFDKRFFKDHRNLTYDVNPFTFDVPALAVVLPLPLRYHSTIKA